MTLELIKSSFKVLRLDKELLLFPLCSTLVLIMLWTGVAFFIFLSISHYFTQVFETFDPSTLETFDPSTVENYGILLILAFYILTHFVITFFNTALVASVLMRLDGRNPTLMDGLRLAASRFWPIFIWSALFGSLSMILKVLEKRLPLFQSMMVSILGLGFSLCSYFVVPFLVQEKLYPIAALKKSSQLIKKTWGKVLVTEVGVWLFGFLMFWLGIGFVAVIAVLTGGLGGYLFLGLIVYISLLWLFCVTVSGIITASVFAYASKGVVLDGFSKDSVETAFR